MSSSDTSTSRDASPRGTNESSPATRRSGPREPGLGEPGDDRLAGPARAPGLVDHEHAPDGLGVADDLVHRQRRQPPHVEDATADAVGREAGGDALGQVAPVAPRHDQHVVALARDHRDPDRDVLVGPRRRWRVGRGPVVVARTVQVAGVVQRDRLEEHRDRAVLDGRRHARAEHGRCVRRVRRRGDHQAGDVAQHGDAVVVVEVAAEAALVAVPGDAHDERVRVLPVGEEAQAGGLAAQLVLGVVEVREVLDLGDRHEAGHAGAERQPEDRLLVEQRVEHPLAAGPLLQPAGHAVHAALGADVLAEHEHPAVGAEQVAERPVDRLRQRERPLVLGQRPEERRSVGGSRAHDGTVGDADGPVRRQRRDDRGGVGEPWSCRQLDGPLAHAGAAVEVPRDERVGRRAAGFDEHPGRGEQRIAGVVGADAGGGPVRRLDVGAGVPAVAHGAQVQDGRARRRAHVVGELLGGVEHADRIGRVRPLVAQAGTVGRATPPPSRRASAR